MELEESFFSISERRMIELTNFTDFELDVDVELMFKKSKLTNGKKEFIIAQILKNLKTGHFYDANAKENCVDDLVMIMLQEIQDFIMIETKCENLKRKRELDLSDIFEDKDRNELVKKRVEFFIFANKEEKKDWKKPLYPILLIENKRPSYCISSGLFQSLLSLYAMNIHCNSEIDLYAILFNGYNWKLVKYECMNKKISLSKSYPFLSAFKSYCNEKYLLANSLLLDVIFSIVLNFLKDP